MPSSLDPPSRYRTAHDADQPGNDDGHRRLFEAWADCADLEPLAVPTVDRDHKPPWRFLTPFDRRKLDPENTPRPEGKGAACLRLHFTVLLGVTDQELLLATIRRRIRIDPDREPRRETRGQVFSASVGVDPASRSPVPTLMTSRLVLLSTRLQHAGGGLDAALRTLPSDAVDEDIWLTTLLDGERHPERMWTRLIARWQARATSATGGRSHDLVHADLRAVAPS